MSNSWRVGVSGRPHCCVLLCIAQLILDPLCVPGLPVIWLCLEVLGHVFFYVGVCARVAAFRLVWGNRIVHIEGGLLPWIERDLLVCLICMERGDGTLQWVVEENRADAFLLSKLK